MKTFSPLIFIILISCSPALKKQLNWEKIALENGHIYDHAKERERVFVFRGPSTKEAPELDICSDQTQDERDKLDDFIIELKGKVVPSDSYDDTTVGLQNYLDDSGVAKYFKAKEMVRPNNIAAAKACGLKELLPSQCRWKSAAAQGLMAIKLRGIINEGRSKEYGLNLRNWWRPTCYNSQVGGAERSDHIQARGFDLDFKTPQDRAKAQKFLCDMYKEHGEMNLQVGIGCVTLHVGIGSPKRSPRYPRDGSRFWTYGSLQTCELKRIKGDDCWKQSSENNKLYIWTKNGRGVL